MPLSPVTRYRWCAAGLLLALGGGCAARFHTVRVKRQVVAVGYGDHLSALGKDAAQLMGALRARREAAKQMDADQVIFRYRPPGGADGLMFEATHLAPAQVIATQEVHDSLKVTVATQRSDAAVAALKQLDTVRTTASAIGTTAAIAHEMAFRRALHKAIVAFQRRQTGPLPSPLSGRATVLDMDVDDAGPRKVRVTLVTHVRFASEAGTAHAGMAPTHDAAFLWRHGDLAGALAELQRSVAREPANAGLHADLGSVCLDMGAVSKAAEAYRKAIELAPKNVEYHLLLGLIEQVLGRNDQAAACFKRVLEIDPNHEGARAALKVLEWREKQPKP